MVKQHSRTTSQSGSVAVGSFWYLVSSHSFPTFLSFHINTGRSTERYPAGRREGNARFGEFRFRVLFEHLSCSDTFYLLYHSWVVGFFHYTDSIPFWIYSPFGQIYLKTFSNPASLPKVLHKALLKSKGLCSSLSPDWWHPRRCRVDQPRGSSIHTHTSITSA